MLKRFDTYRFLKSTKAGGIGEKQRHGYEFFFGHRPGLKSAFGSRFLFFKRRLFFRVYRGTTGKQGEESKTLTRTNVDTHTRARQTPGDTPEKTAPKNTLGAMNARDSKRAVRGWATGVARPSLLGRFTLLGGIIVVLEVILGSWPVVATSIWGMHAVASWIHFLYWIKAFFLFLAVFQSWWAPWRFQMNAWGRSNGAGRRRADRPGMLEFCLGATASCELGTWMMISIFVHALLSSVVLLLVLVLKHEFESDTQWILSVVFNGVAILESIGSPLLLTNFGLRPILGIDIDPAVKQPAHARIPQRQVPIEMDLLPSMHHTAANPEHRYECPV